MNKAKSFTKFKCDRCKKLCSTRGIRLLGNKALCYLCYGKERRDLFTVE